MRYPQNFASLISQVAIIDVVSPDRVIFGLTGPQIDIHTGINPKGVNVLDYTGNRNTRFNHTKCG